jgi:hypothetical protein
MRNLTLLAFCLALFLLRASYGHQRLVVFGDSLSDDGNTFAVSGILCRGIEYVSFALNGLLLPPTTTSCLAITPLPGCALAAGLAAGCGRTPMGSEFSLTF